MKVVLLTHVRNCGQKGEIKEVSDGYYQNFLAPRKLAVPATNSQVNHVRAQQAKATEKLENMKESALAVKEKIQGQTLPLICKASDAGKLYASLHAKDIAQAIKDHLKVEIPEKQIHLEEPIKTLGETTVNIQLYKDVSANLLIRIASN